MGKAGSNVVQALVIVRRPFLTWAFSSLAKLSCVAIAVMFWPPINLSNKMSRLAFMLYTMLNNPTTPTAVSNSFVAQPSRDSCTPELSRSFLEGDQLPYLKYRLNMLEGEDSAFNNLKITFWGWW